MAAGIRWLNLSSRCSAAISRHSSSASVEAMVTTPTDCRCAMVRLRQSCSSLTDLQDSPTLAQLVQIVRPILQKCASLDFEFRTVVGAPQAVAHRVRELGPGHLAPQRTHQPGLPRRNPAQSRSRSGSKLGLIRIVVAQLRLNRPNQYCHCLGLVLKIVAWLRPSEQN